MVLDKPRYINVAGQLLDLSTPKVMGIINITPDSFYKGSRVVDEKDILRAASEMIRDGADILDIGGYSSRPGASDVSVDEEKKRVLEAISLIHGEHPDAIISVDTFRPEVAYDAVTKYGASMINDISGGEADNDMFNIVKTLNVPYILMHMQGRPDNMQQNPAYDDVVSDILKWFGKRIVRLQSMGVKDIIIDPGFGFGKTVRHNFELLSRLGDFSITGLPLMAGISRKSMIWKTLGTSCEEALNGTTVLNTVALIKGADILRVHDVKEAVESVKLIMSIRSTENQVFENKEKNNR